MTLIITELSEYGIAMIADSAVTIQEEPSSGHTVKRVLTGARKLQFISHLDAGISTWGNAELPGPATLVSTDVWMYDFIQRHTTTKSIDEFANELAEELQQLVGHIKKPLGFHLAGYVEQGGKRLPTFYHVRNVDGPYRNYRFHEFILGQDVPPREIVGRQDRHLTRNGDFGPYAVLSQAVDNVLPLIRSSLAVDVPYPSLQGRIAYLTAWIRFISDLYDSAALLPTIGGTIASLGIAPDGQVLRSKVMTP